MLENYALNPTPAVLAYLNERQRIAADGSIYFAADDGHPHLDIHREGCPNADARAVAAWTRKHRPELWNATPSTAPVAETATTAPSVNSSSTAADLMAAVRSGRLSADDAARRLLSTRPSETRSAPTMPASGPAYAAATMSSLMIRARAGDASALAALTSRYLDPRK